MNTSILVPVDGSEHSRKALEFACNLANNLKAKLHLLHVAQAPHQDQTLVLGAAAITLHATRAELEQAGAKVLDAAKAIATERGCRIEAAEVAGGDPAQIIVSKASEHHVDMIVMGSRGISDLSGLLLGSVSHKVNQLAPCTCITVR